MCPIALGTDGGGSIRIPADHCGLQIIGRHLDQPTVLRAAAAIEAARPWRDRWPPLLAAVGQA